MRRSINLPGCLSLLFLLCLNTVLSAGLVFEKQSEEQDPKTIVAANLLGRGVQVFHEARTAFQNGEHEECAAILEGLRREDRGLPPKELILVWMLMSDGKLAEAKKTLERVAALYPNHPQTSLTLGQIALSERRFADAAALLEKAVSVSMPTEWNADQQKRFALQGLDTLAQVYSAQGRWKSEKQTLEAALNLERNSRRSIRLARALVSLAEFESAEQLLKGVVSRDISLPAVPLLMAKIAFQAGKKDRVGGFLDRALKEIPEDEEARLWNLEWALVERDFEKASRLVDQLAGKADDSEILRLRGLLQNAKGQRLKAIPLLEKALESETASSNLPTKVQLLSIKTWDAIESSDKLPAILEQVEGLALKHPSNGNVLSLLGWIYGISSRPEEAELMLARGAQLSSTLTPDQGFYMADHLRRLEDPAARERGLEMLRTLEDIKYEFFLLKDLATQTLRELENRE